jgi:hypothetical protein
MTLEEYKQLHDRLESEVRALHAAFPRSFSDTMKTEFVKSLEAIAALKRIISHMQHEGDSCIAHFMQHDSKVEES